jgi:serine/threonine protein kinase
MTPERWKAIEALYHAAHAVPQDGRADFLGAACPDDHVLRREVESLLAEADSERGLLDNLSLAVTAHLLADLAAFDMAGQTLGSYALTALLGSGGMGDVYRARDTRLGRDVAIKILPRAFTSNPDRLARFEREARMLAALNHPNICGIYGFEAVAVAEGPAQPAIRFLVLELVEGDTLAQMLADASPRGAPAVGLPLQTALSLAHQIAQALEAAHDKGMVHRDLKPANIKVTPGGVVKVLDFGLAKPVSGDGVSPTLTRVPADADAAGGDRVVLGTAAYMSPEQARGLPVDKRTDIWAYGCVVFEMLTGRGAFAADTGSDSIAKILEREPDWSALPAETPTPVRRLLLRCLTKDPTQRLRDIGDARVEIDAIDELLPGTARSGEPPAPTVTRARWLPWMALGALAAGVVVREARRPEVIDSPLANARFTRFTNWAGTEERAEISPDGNFVAFLADKAGQLDVWSGQVGTGHFGNLTLDIPPMRTPGNLLRPLGFAGDGSEIWFSRSGNPGAALELMPLTGGMRRPFLPAGRSTPSWSPDNAHLVEIGSSTPGDPLSLADRTGADARRISVPNQGALAFFRRGVHAHNPVWSPDGQWVYFVYGPDPFGDMDIWRVRPSGQSPEQLTHQRAPVNFIAPLDARTVLYVARADDWSGPWLWALDVESKAARRVTTGLEQFTSVSASRDGRRVVATVANPTASLWRVPLVDRLIVDTDAAPYPMPTERALAPRFGGTSLFYLSLAARGAGDSLWRAQAGDAQAFEVRRGADGVVSEPPAVSPDGSRVAVVVRRQGRRQLAVMSADGTNSRTIAASVAIRGVAGQCTVDWSPDGAWIVSGGSDEQGPGLFKIPVDGGPAVRLVTGEARGPAWSPTGDLIVYATPFGSAGGNDAIRGVRPDGTPVPMPKVAVRIGGAHRFLRNGAGLVYLPGIEYKDFWLLDLATQKSRQLTELRDRGYVNGFDVTRDGQYLVFDRTRQNSDIVLIERPTP